MQVAVLDCVKNELGGSHAIILDGDIELVGSIAETDQHDGGIRMPVDVRERFVDHRAHDIVHRFCGWDRP